MQLAITEINSGCYWFKTADLLEVLFDIKPENAQGEYYLTDCIELLIAKGKRLTHLFLQILMLRLVQMTDVVCLH